nr:MAG TPA: hypothetical protein [Caudoviricetes sp.]
MTRYSVSEIRPNTSYTRWLSIIPFFVSIRPFISPFQN